MEKPMIKNIAKFSIRVALVAAVAFPLIIAMSARAQEPAPTAPADWNKYSHRVVLQPQLKRRRTR